MCCVGCLGAGALKLPEQQAPLHSEPCCCYCTLCGCRNSLSRLLTRVCPQAWCLLAVIHAHMLSIHLRTHTGVTTRGCFCIHAHLYVYMPALTRAHAQGKILWRWAGSCQRWTPLLLAWRVWATPQRHGCWQRWLSASPPGVYRCRCVNQCVAPCVTPCVASDVMCREWCTPSLM